MDRFNYSHTEEPILCVNFCVRVTLLACMLHTHLLSCMQFVKACCQNCCKSYNVKYKKSRSSLEFPYLREIGSNDSVQIFKHLCRFKICADSLRYVEIITNEFNSYQLLIVWLLISTFRKKSYEFSSSTDISYWNKFSSGYLDFCF